MLVLLKAAVIGVALVAPNVVAAQVPDEVTGITFDDSTYLTWNPIPNADEYVVYGGPLSRLRSGILLHCDGDTVLDAPYAAEEMPGAGDGLFYFVTARGPDGEGTPGMASNGLERYLGASCQSLLRDHILDRVGFGWSEWARDRIALFGIQGYIDEQLDPSAIDESGNTELADRIADIEPPDTIDELRAVDLVRAVYSRRQLEQRVALFWANHFNTEYRESFKFFGRYGDDPPRRRLEATHLHYDELEAFRFRAFNGNFREILEDSAQSRAMTIYLDTDSNTAGSPNENYAREHLELHTMGVDGGFTHHEINSMARVMTGWDVCKKLPADLGSLTSPCIANSLIGTASEPAGEWVMHFRRNKHDCGEKILFPASGYETVIPDTCSNPIDGVNDLFLALDVIAAHPSTASFISTKLLREFVTDEPTQAMLDNVVAVWNDGSNPHGVGDLREVLAAVLAQAEFLDVGSAGNKVKTPFEHVASAFRALRGRTNGNTRVRAALDRMRHALHENPIPTGYAEKGDAWIDTNNLLERMNFGMDLTGRTGSNFGTDLIGLLEDNGISTLPDNEVEIVDFFIDVLFGGALPADYRQAAIEYLSTDDSGVPGNYNTARIRETVGLLLGFPEFAEQ